MGKSIAIAVAVGAFAGLVGGVIGGVLAVRDVQRRTDAINAEVEMLGVKVNGLIVEQAGDTDRFGTVAGAVTSLAARLDAFYCTIEQDTKQGICMPSVGDCIHFAGLMSGQGKAMTPCWVREKAFCTEGDNGETCATDEGSCEQLRAARVMSGAKMSACTERTGNGT